MNARSYGIPEGLHQKIKQHAKIRRTKGDTRSQNGNSDGAGPMTTWDDGANDAGEKQHQVTAPRQGTETQQVTSNG